MQVEINQIIANVIPEHIINKITLFVQNAFHNAKPVLLEQNVRNVNQMTLDIF
jgi:hypothetical protein